jgi:hypothetical protein
LAFTIARSHYGDPTTGSGSGLARMHDDDNLLADIQYFSAKGSC